VPRSCLGMEEEGCEVVGLKLRSLGVVLAVGLEVGVGDTAIEPL